jgi:hypothetical protein
MSGVAKSRDVFDRNDSREHHFRTSCGRELKRLCVRPEVLYLAANLANSADIQILATLRSVERELPLA